MKRDFRIWYLALGFFVVFGAFSVLAYPIWIPDVVNRYAPMAEEFARGNWWYAYHPRFGVLFQSLAGPVAFVLSHVPFPSSIPVGGAACQIVSTLFLALAAVPMWHLVKDLFGERCAWWTVAFLLVGDEFAREACEGLRDTGKCLAFALIGYGLVRRSSLWLGVGAFVLTTLVSYGFVVAAILSVAWMPYFLCTRVREERLVAVRTLFPFVAFLLGAVADSVMVHAYTGHWLPMVQAIKVFGGWL